jgi:hypothetical protein
MCRRQRGAFLLLTPAEVGKAPYCGASALPPLFTQSGTTSASRWRWWWRPWRLWWRRLRPGRIGDDHAALPPKVGPSSNSPTVGSLFAAWRAIQPAALGRERLAACGARPSGRMLVSLRPVSGVLNPFAAVGGASDDRSPIPSCQSCQIDDRPLAAIAGLSP